MRKRVERYVQNYTTCQQDKPARHLLYGNLQSLQTPTKPWEWITIDFIVKLPISEGFNTITVITNQLTKYIYLILTNKTINSP